MTPKALLALLALSVVPIFAAEKPNFVLILADDQGWTALSTSMHPTRDDAKSTYYETPNLDRIVRTLGLVVLPVFQGTPDPFSPGLRWVFPAPASDPWIPCDLTFAGADAYLTKPADPEELVETARRLLRRPLRTA